MREPGGRLVYLDVLRSVAVLLFVGHHTFYPVREGTWGRGFFIVWQRVGWVAADLFFVLSGFLIGGLLMNEHLSRGRIDQGRFYIRQIFKIWPCYFLLLLQFAALPLFRNWRHPPAGWAESVRRAKSIWPNLLHLQNYLGTRLTITWSLAVEEHFYVLLPPVLVLLASRGGGTRRGCRRCSR